MRRILILVLLVGATAVLIQCKKTTTLLFIGSYTEGLPAKGIKVYKLDVEKGQTKLLSEVESIINPSFLRLSDNGQVLYVASESQMKTDGFISSYSVDSQSGELKLINKQSTLGRNPVHIEISPNQNSIVVSNYTGASIALYNVDLNGRISPPKQHLAFQDSSIIKGRQDQAHIHSCSFSRDGKYMFAHDLGGDKIRAFGVADTLLDANVADLKMTAGAGPRHFAFDKPGKYGYLLSELGGYITALEYNNQDGQMKEIGEYQTYGQKQEIYRSADIHMHPSLDLVYVSNRGPEENTVVVFKKLGDGKLEFAQRVNTEGEHPRNFAIDQSGNCIIIANQFTDNIVLRKLNRKSGFIEEVINEIKFDNPSTVQVYQY